MNISIKKLVVSRSSDSHIRIAIQQDGCQYSEYDTFFCISHTEWRYVRACCLGISDIYPYWDDGLYLLKFHPHGIRCIHTSGTKEDVWFTFPTSEMVELIDLQFDNLGKDWRNDPLFLHTVDFTPRLGEWAIEYGPNVQVKVDQEVLDRLALDEVHPLLKRPGQGLLKHLTHVAAGYSNGNPISVNIQFDSLSDMRRYPEEPTSYYWWIWDENEKVRLYNGGYIAHRYEQPDGTYLFDMSIHT